jgi:hypothetical protein
MSYQIYWLTWFISLLVTTFNGILTLFKIDKKYYFLHTTLEQLRSEAWQYIYLSGKYSGHYTKGIGATHQNQYVFFCHNMEKIKLKQVEEEYYKLIESHGGSSGSGSSGAGAEPTTGHDKHHEKHIAGLYTPTPDVSELLSHQQQIARALMLGNQKHHTSIDIDADRKDKEKETGEDEEEDEPPPPLQAQAQRRGETAASTGLSMR